MLCESLVPKAAEQCSGDAVLAQMGFIIWVLLPAVEGQYLVLL